LTRPDPRCPGGEWRHRFRGPDPVDKNGSVVSKPAGRAHWDPYAADYAQHAEPELGVDLGAFFFEFGEAGQDAAAQGGDGAGVGVVAGLVVGVVAGRVAASGAGS